MSYIKQIERSYLDVLVVTYALTSLISNDTLHPWLLSTSAADRCRR